MIRIGCAGWSIASRQAGLFGEGDSVLARYATRFDAVEVNSTFYRSHRPDTFVRWAAAVPRTFRFSVKLPKTITHEARLVRTAPLIRAFAQEVAGLGAKLGGVLVQLPPSLAFDARVAGAFFRAMRAAFDAPLCCEPRHGSWFESRVDALWERFDIARVAADPPQPEGAGAPGDAGRWRYFRLHGAPRMYYSAYDDARLVSLAAQLRACDRQRRPVWCIFDNTAHSHAVENAARLQEMLGLR
ncbi:DUF72 domain containing protein [Lysobacter dokdonensis DS-58]|uniref:DUF72 domain containing protein n=1 Tax=Lysobacter dokdonensis DS-58 TaxID=1300345 RepID=A0A0A2WQL5_9GAMM|nr:DUF72 domain-containing protein [Lysobacter dokdonensis]KGQ20575.1 DUF72 domain containing protein [Lysobacter dokdonensis DS-58]